MRGMEPMCGLVGLAPGKRQVLGLAEQQAGEFYELRQVDEGVKESQRRSVVDFLIAHHQPREFMRVLSLPDERWTFERMIDSRRDERCTFLALQRSWMHIEKAMPWMLGSRLPQPYSEKMDVGSFVGYVTDRARSAFCHAGHFLSLSLADIQRGPKSLVKENRKAFNEKYRRNTAVWMDLHCQLCRESMRVATNVSKWVWPFKHHVPIVISFLAARDDFDSDKDRVATLSAWLNDVNKFREFVVRDVWRHQSAESPYLSVAGVLRLKRGQPEAAA